MITETRILMGMPIAVSIADGDKNAADAVEKVFGYFAKVDARFSPFKKDSELSRMNRGELEYDDLSAEMKEVLGLAKATKAETAGFFDIEKPDGSLDTSGIVKGWAIRNAAMMLRRLGFSDFYVNAGGDIEVSGEKEAGKSWSAGISDPFDKSFRRIVKKVRLESGKGIATSGVAARGAHIWNPKSAGGKTPDEVVSITVIGPNILEADRFATAAFAMGKDGIAFIERMPGLEGYQIGKDGTALMTSGFSKYAL